MKAQILNKSGKETKSIDLPKNFSTEIRKDIVQKIFEAQKREQSYGTLIGSGAGYSASGISKKARHKWKGTYGKGISRIPRKIMSRHGSSFNWVGATATNTRGGRTAHPPRSEKNQFRKINKKELLLAINSCFSASIDKKILKTNYGIDISKVPLVVNKEVLEMKTKEFIEFLKLLFGKDYEKTLKRKIRRSGKGKLRGRKYRSSLGILFVLGKNEKMNRKGVDVVKVDDISISDISINGLPGRVIAYSEESIKEIGEKWKK